MKANAEELLEECREALGKIAREEGRVREWPIIARNMLNKLNASNLSHKTP